MTTHVGPMTMAMTMTMTHDHDLDPDRVSISKPKLMKDVLQVKIRIREKYVVQITPAFKV